MFELITVERSIGPLNAIVILGRTWNPSSWLSRTFSTHSVGRGGRTSHPDVLRLMCRPVFCDRSGIVNRSDGDGPRAQSSAENRGCTRAFAAALLPCPAAARESGRFEAANRAQSAVQILDVMATPRRRTAAAVATHHTNVGCRSLRAASALRL